MPRTPTVSVRLARTTEELWLDPAGRWNDYQQRKRFRTDDAAEAFLRLHCGTDFCCYGLFPNS